MVQTKLAFTDRRHLLNRKTSLPCVKEWRFTTHIGHGRHFFCRLEEAAMRERGVEPDDVTQTGEV